MSHKAGDVAIVTALNTEPYRAYFDGKTWREYGSAMFCVDTPATIRPLVVLDHSHLADALDGLRRLLKSDLPMLIDEVRALSELANQIEAQTKPPRIPEPGLWAVVEASTSGNSERREFGRIPERDVQHWIESDAMGWFRWADLIDPALVRDGIEATS